MNLPVGQFSALCPPRLGTLLQRLSTYSGKAKTELWHVLAIRGQRQKHVYGLYKFARDSILGYNEPPLDWVLLLLDRNPLLSNYLLLFLDIASALKAVLSYPRTRCMRGGMGPWRWARSIQIH